MLRFSCQETINLSELLKLMKIILRNKYIRLCNEGMLCVRGSSASEECIIRSVLSGHVAESVRKCIRECCVYSGII